LEVAVVERNTRMLVACEDALVARLDRRGKMGRKC
jgi:hypothetical protein